MNVFMKKLAESKFFVPIIIIIFILIVLSSLTEKKETKIELTTERQLEEICNTICGVKNAKVMITYDAISAASIFDNSTKTTKIQGIAVVCEGGSDPTVQLSLHNMLKSLFGISSTRITVSERKPSELS